MRRKTFKWLGLTLVALTVALLPSVGLWIWRSSYRLEERLAAIRAAGDPVTMSDLSPEPIAPESNAATYLAEASKDAETIETKLGAVVARTSEPGFPTADELRQIAEAFQAHPSVIPLLHKAADCKVYDTPLSNTFSQSGLQDVGLADAQSVRRHARLLTLHAELLRHEGKREEAITDCMTLLRLSNLYGRNQFLLDYLVSLAMRQMAMKEANKILRSGPVAPETRQALETLLTEYDALNAFRNALKRERVLGLAMIEQFPRGPAWILQGATKWRYLDLMEGQIAAETYAESGLAIAELPEPGLIRFPGLVVKQVAPSIHAARKAMERSRAVSRSLLVLIALQRFAEVNPGKEPTLADLRLPPEATVDPFTGEPLKLKRTEGGEWLIYSVGDDLTDDGGDLAGSKDFGLGPLHRSETTKMP